MALRLPNGNSTNEDENGTGSAAAAAAAAAAAFQSALGQQVRPFLGGWDPVTAMAAMQRNLLQQQHQQQQQQQQQQQNATLNQHHQSAASVAGVTPPTSLATGPNPVIPPLWAAAYGLPTTTATAGPGAGPLINNHAQPGIPPVVSSTSTAAAAAAAAASLASLSNPASNYLNSLQSHLQTPESFLTFQQNLLLLEQINQQRQLLGANPHLLMAAAAAQSMNQTATQPNQHPSHSQNNDDPGQHQHPHHQLTNPTEQLQQQLLQQQHLNLLNSLANSRLLAGQQQLQQQAASLLNGGSKFHLNSNGINLNALGLNGTSSGSSSSNNMGNISNSSSNSSLNASIHNNGSLLTTVNTNTMSPSMRTTQHQHQDSLVEQHFRRSLGEDYNQILTNKP